VGQIERENEYDWMDFKGFPRDYLPINCILSVLLCELFDKVITRIKFPNRSGKYRFFPVFLERALQVWLVTVTNLKKNILTFFLRNKYTARVLINYIKMIYF